MFYKQVVFIYRWSLEQDRLQLVLGSENITDVTEGGAQEVLQMLASNNTTDISDVGVQSGHTAAG